jgi:hypothetical protein
MKNSIKVLIIILTAIAMAAIWSTAASAKVGDYAGPRCDTGMTICEDPLIDKIGSDRDRFYLRIHNLEVLVEQQRQRIEELESRTSLIEDIVEDLQTKVISALQNILTFISNLVKIIK